MINSPQPLDERSIARKAAIEMLRNANEVFVAYSSQDLDTARDVRRRILALRTNKAQESVFLAAESLPAGEPVSPELVENALRSAHLFVVLCGRTTSHSLWVAREVEIALSMQSNGFEILPVILKSGVQLPKGLDFAIQGIHIEHLFPRLFWRRVMKVVVAMLLVVLTSSAIYLEYGRRRELSRGEIQRWLDIDATKDASPIDVGRTCDIDRLNQIAVRFQLVDLKSKLEGLRRRVIEPTKRRDILPPDINRHVVETSPFDNVVWIGYPDKLESYRPDGSRVHLLDFSSIEPMAPWEKEHPLAIKGGKQRLPHLIAVEFEPRIGGVSAEVEYDGPSHQPKGELLEKDNLGRWTVPSTGEWIEGVERELLRLNSAGSLTSMGLTQRLVWVSSSNPLGEETGGSKAWYEVDTSHGLSVRTTLGQPNHIQCQDVLSWSGGKLYDYAHSPPCADNLITITTIAFDPEAQHSLLEVAFPPDPEGRIQDLMKDSRTHFILWQRLGLSSLRTTSFYTYHPRAKYLYFEDEGGFKPEDFEQEEAEEKIRPTLTGISEEGGLYSEQRTCPIAALSVKHSIALICGELVSLMDGSRRLVSSFIKGQSAHSAWFKNDGRFLVVILNDGSIEVVLSSTGDIIHRCTRPSWARDMAVLPDGQAIWVLMANGAVVAWPLEEFAEDGWARSVGAKEQEETASTQGLKAK
jgi:hypothetical protein